MNCNEEIKSLYIDNDKDFFYELNNFFHIKNELSVVEKVIFLCKIKKELCTSKYTTTKKPKITKIKKKHGVLN